MELLVFGGREKEVWAEEADRFWGKFVLGVGPQRLCSGCKVGKIPEFYLGSFVVETSMPCG
jgi:hypothetical protein